MIRSESRGLLWWQWWRTNIRVSRWRSCSMSTEPITLFDRDPATLQGVKVLLVLIDGIQGLIIKCGKTCCSQLGGLSSSKKRRAVDLGGGLRLAGSRGAAFLSNRQRLDWRDSLIIVFHNANRWERLLPVHWIRSGSNLSLTFLHDAVESILAWKSRLWRGDGPSLLVCKSDTAGLHQSVQVGDDLVKLPNGRIGIHCASSQYVSCFGNLALRFWREVYRGRRLHCFLCVWHMFIPRALSVRIPFSARCWWQIIDGAVIVYRNGCRFRDVALLGIPYICPGRCCCWRIRGDGPTIPRFITQQSELCADFSSIVDVLAHRLARIWV